MDEYENRTAAGTCGRWPAVSAYGLAVLCALTATLLRMTFDPLWGERLPYIFFYPAVMISALYGGLRAGVLCALIGACAVLLLFPSYKNPFLTGQHSMVTSMIAYLVVSGSLAALAAGQRNARRKIEVHVAQLERQEEKLRENEERLRAIVDQALVGIAQADPQGRIVMANGRFCELVGRTREQLIGQYFRDITHPDDVPLNLRLYENLIRTGVGYEMEKRFLRPDGGMVWVANSVAALTGPVGGPYGAVAVVQDITSRKEQEERLRSLNAELGSARDKAVEASRAKSVFLANMSHELRTPLNAVIGYAEMVEEELRETGNEPMAEDVDKIRVSGNHLLTIISDILDISRIEAGRMELVADRFSVEEVVREAVGLVMPLVEKKKNRIRTDCIDGVGTMHADRTRFRQILFNLLSNAAKFTEHGSIAVLCGRETDPEGRKWIVISVSDTGIGMAPHQVERLFQKFEQLDSSFTRRHGGTGLGLVISRHLCRMMGGEITVQSEPGYGSTFTVRLPSTGAPEPVAVSPLFDTGVRPL